MDKFFIAATDTRTNATLYAKVSPTGRTLAFKNGLSIADDELRFKSLNVNRRQGTPVEGDTALRLLTEQTKRIAELGDKAWVRDLRIVAAD